MHAPPQNLNISHYCSTQNGGVPDDQIVKMAAGGRAVKMSKVRALLKTIQPKPTSGGI